MRDRRQAPSPCTTTCPNNLALDYDYGDREKTEPGFAEAAHVVRVELRAQRIAGNPMEPKSCLARYDAARRARSRSACRARAPAISRRRWRRSPGLGREKFLIRSVDVGGGFGVRNEIYPEFLAVMLAAKRTGRPVKWTGTRSETMSGDHHARAADLTGELALDDKGTLPRAARPMAGQSRRVLLERGRRSSTRSRRRPARRSASTTCRRCTAGTGWCSPTRRRRRPIAAPDVRTSPICGSGWSRRRRVKLGMDSIKLRRRNLLRKDSCSRRRRRPARPTTAPIRRACSTRRWRRRTGTALPSGGRRPSARASCAASGLRCSSSPPAAWARSRSRLRVEPDGRLAMFSLAGPSGQGHETVFPALVADILGYARGPDRSARTTTSPRRSSLGTGSFGSRSLISHGAALVAGAKEIVEKGTKLAATRARGRARRRDLRQGRVPRRRHRPSVSIADVDREEMGRGRASARHQHHASILRRRSRAAPTWPRSRSIRDTGASRS